MGAARITDSSTCAQVASVLAKLSVCRTHVMGGRKYQCADCDEVTTRYNSCGDRHCPGCSGSKRFDFNTRASKLLLPGVVYYQVVFTLPSELSELALANRQAMAELLNDSAWQSLSKHIKREQAYEPAGISVLHTWNQHLDAHWHVHLLVPGEGPSLGGVHWKRAESPAAAANSDGFYLVDADRLRTAYRTRAIRRLRHLRQSGQLQLGGKFAYLQSDENWEAFIGNLESTPWVAYIQPPPNRTSRANEVVNYLTRYLTGRPISDARITATDQDNVTFLTREGKKTGGERKQVPITMPLESFVRSWCLHIQPEQLTKTRYLGGWSNTCCAAYMTRCREACKHLAATDPAHPAATDQAQEPPSPLASQPPGSQNPLVCTHCGSDRLVLTSETAKPSWREIFGSGSESCPTWYREWQRADDDRFWTALMGEGFNDWYLETVIESAKAPPAKPSPPIQLYLTGIRLSPSYQLDSF